MCTSVMCSLDVLYVLYNLYPILCSILLHCLICISVHAAFYGEINDNNNNNNRLGSAWNPAITMYLHQISGWLYIDTLYGVTDQLCKQ